MDFRADHRQSQTLSPRLQHAVRLLQLSSLDFSATVRDLLGRNPFLEAEDSEDGEDGQGDVALPDDFAAAAAGDDGDMAVDFSAREVQADDHDDRDLWQAEGPGSLRQAGDGELSALELTAADTSLAMHLHSQVNLLALPERVLFVARAIIESIDDDGYLRCSEAELVPLVPMTPPATPDELLLGLAVVQTLEPAGVGARSVGECLQLQFSAIPCPDMRRLAQRIVEQHLPLLAARDVQGLARVLNKPVAEVDKVCERIRRLDPHPGWRFGSSRTAYVVPDVIVRRVQNRWTVQLNPAVVPKVRLNQVYADLFKRHRTTENAEMTDQLQEARWTLRNVEQRFSTIMAVAEAIVRRQQNFLEFGAMAMKPMGLKEIADEVGIHESTVSRVTNNKYMATPSGVFELKYFFSRVIVSSNGSACSGTAIRGLLKDIITAEHPAAPLSDAEITRQLTQQGLVVARRTVTKYRQMLQIESVERRRRQAPA